jgi:hypothetical protein
MDLRKMPSLRLLMSVIPFLEENPFSWVTKPVLKAKALLVNAEVAQSSPFADDTLLIRLHNGDISSGEYWSDQRTRLIPGSTVPCIFLDRGSGLPADSTHAQWVLVLKMIENRKTICKG